MPTPSSHTEPEAVSLNSTCPEDQIDRVETRSMPSPVYDEINESPAAASATQETIVDDSTSSPSDTLQNDQSQYSADGPQSPYTPSSLAMSPSTLHDDEQHTDAADKQAEMEIGERHPTTAYGSPSGSRGTRAAPDAIGGRRFNIRGPTVPYASRLDSRMVAHYSIPEADIWQPTGTKQVAASQASSRPCTMNGVSTHEGWGDDDFEDEYMYPENLPSYMPCDPTSLRIVHSYTSKFLRPGSRFVGTQQSERQVYDVQVEIKHVDLRESFLSGYLRIQGLTEDHPTLTTYFEGEIIGSKYGFNTKHQTWGANDRIDMSHWAKFGAFRPYSKPAKKGGIYTIKDHLQKENIFMRWKEHFLVPNHRVRTIHGASFEGFYYICFNQLEGVVHGIYFHSKSEKFQQLELKHVEDKGCHSAVEFR